MIIHYEVAMCKTGCMCISKELCSKGMYILAPEFSHISKIQMFTLGSEWPKNQKATILICKTLYQSSNFSNTVKNFKTEKLKEYYSEHPHTASQILPLIFLFYVITYLATWISKY